MSYNRYSSGCGSLIVPIIIVGFLGFFLVKGCIALVSNIDFDGNWNKRPAQTDTRPWGENGVDPVLRTSEGGVYKDPNDPNHYFDITQWCPNCDGVGCAECYNTGHPKVLIPANGELPKKKMLPDDYYKHKGAALVHRH